MNYGKKALNERLRSIGSEENRQKNRFSMFLVVLLVMLFVGGVLSGAALCIGSFTEILRNVPDVDSVSSVEPGQKKSIIYAADGSVMQELVESGSNRIPVSYSQFPPHLVDAFIAIEDARFFDHEGVDVKGIIRAIFVGLTSGNLSEGASTITQQLIKNNVFNGGVETNMGDRLERKFQEQYLALRVEKELDKKTIIEHYLNTINLGSNCLGVQVASKRYFNKNVRELDLAECAVLAATTSSPTRYNPITHPDNNQRRRLIVLRYMLNDGMITPEEFEEASSENVYKRIQTVAASYTGQHAFSYFTDTVFEQVLDRLQTELGYSETAAYSMLYSGGLRIYTTEDPALQKIVDEEVNREANYEYQDDDGHWRTCVSYSLSYQLGIRIDSGEEFYYNETNLEEYFTDVVGKKNFKLLFETEDILHEATNAYRDYILRQTGGKVILENVSAILEPQTSAVLIDQSTGYVRAVSGGRGNKDELGSLVLNRATQSTRQPGSTFKILTTYAPAIDLKNATLASTYYDSELLIENRKLYDWWGTYYTGYTNIREAIMVSSNIVAVMCLENTVTENLGFEFARSFGITSLVSKDKSPVMTLGGLTYGVSNLEMTAAYAAIANRGTYVTPIFWTKVTDLNGKTVLENVQTTDRVIREETAKLLTSAMQSTIEPEFAVFPKEGVVSTNVSCHVNGIALAAKSGTTNDANDLWLIGYSPAYTLGVWCGYDESQVIGYGSQFHRNIWRSVMARIHTETEVGDVSSFDYSGLVKAKICSKSGLLAKEGVCSECGDPNCHVYEEYFTRSTVPTEYCTRHTVYHICEESGALANEFCPEESVKDVIYFSIDPKDQSGTETDDTKYVIPFDLIGIVCDIHEEEPTETPETQGLPDLYRVP